jgi:hypothetical protein
MNSKMQWAWRSRRKGLTLLRPFLSMKITSPGSTCLKKRASIKSSAQVSLATT